MMITHKIVLSFLVLIAVQATTATSFDEYLTYNEDSKFEKNIRDPISATNNELKRPIKISINSLIDSIASKLLNTELGKFIADAISDTPKFVARVNAILGKNVLILEGNSLTISYINATEVIRLQTNRFLEENLKLHGVLLSFIEGISSRILTDFSRVIKPVVDRVNFTVPSKPTSLQGSAGNAMRRFVLDVVVILLRPSQHRLNETLFNATNELLSLYKPVLPNDYFQSIFSCGINQTILKAIDLIETIREAVNEILVPKRLKKREVKVLSVAEEKEKTSLIGFIVRPIRFLLIAILTPVHRMLKSLMNYVFVTIRPVVGRVILSPIESLVMALINLIPCSRC